MDDKDFSGQPASLPADRPGEKLIFLDIDGTLTPFGENTPPESAVRAIKKAQEKGNRVFICTGRNPYMLEPLLRYGFDGFVGCAGGYVAIGNQAGGEILFDCPMTDRQRDTALDSLHRNGAFCTIEAKDCAWGDEKLSDFVMERPEGKSEIEQWRKMLVTNLGLRPLSEYDGRPIYKVVAMCLELSQLEETRALMERDFQFVAQERKDRGGSVSVEIINRKFDKGRGIELICEKLGVSREDTIGFGDSMNDLEMIQTVGTSVCMGNGAKKLKEIADLVCPPVTENGLFRAFEKLHLI
ncbi:MAG: HAD family hydrolase [Fretibacterium sp.]|nr:HAD family hydrolase [Fretibacterium sp.]